MAFPRRRHRIDLAPDGLITAKAPFGVLARRRARRRIAVGVIGLVLVIGAFTLYAWLTPEGVVRRTGIYPVRVRCDTCDADWVVDVPFQSRFPVSCPLCKRLTAYPLWACRECSARFRPDPVAAVQVCPACGSRLVGTAAVPSKD
jgi:DNA-directed RNA polymerase subunit RPC12/RpoP